MTTQAPDLNSPAAARAGIAAGVLAYIIWGLMRDFAAELREPFGSRRGLIYILYVR